MFAFWAVKKTHELYPSHLGITAMFGWTYQRVRLMRPCTTDTARFLPEEMILARPVQKFPTFAEPQCSSPRSLTQTNGPLSWARCIQSTHPRPTYIFMTLHSLMLPPKPVSPTRSLPFVSLLFFFLIWIYCVFIMFYHPPHTYDTSGPLYPHRNNISWKVITDQALLSDR